VEKPFPVESEIGGIGSVVAVYLNMSPEFELIIKFLYLELDVMKALGSNDAGMERVATRGNIR
jgi:hypothetical protein